MAGFNSPYNLLLVLIVSALGYAKPLLPLQRQVSEATQSFVSAFTEVVIVTEIVLAPGFEENSDLTMMTNPSTTSTLDSTPLIMSFTTDVTSSATEPTLSVPQGSQSDLETMVSSTDDTAVSETTQSFISTFTEVVIETVVVLASGTDLAVTINPSTTSTIDSTLLIISATVEAMLSVTDSTLSVSQGAQSDLETTFSTLEDTATVITDTVSSSASEAVISAATSSVSSFTTSIADSSSTMVTLTSSSPSPSGSSPTSSTSSSPTCRTLSGTTIPQLMLVVSDEVPAEPSIVETFTGDCPDILDETTVCPYLCPVYILGSERRVCRAMNGSEPENVPRRPTLGPCQHCLPPCDGPQASNTSGTVAMPLTTSSLPPILAPKPFTTGSPAQCFNGDLQGLPFLKRPPLTDLTRVGKPGTAPMSLREFCTTDLRNSGRCPALCFSYKTFNNEQSGPPYFQCTNVGIIDIQRCIICLLNCTS